MLTADLVNVRRRGTALRLVALDSAARERALAIAARLLLAVNASVGQTREDLDQALATVDVGTREVRLRDGLTKLIEDRCTFDARDDLDPEVIRREVFTRASELRSAANAQSDFERAAIFDAVAQAHGVTGQAVEKALFADLRAAHVLLSFDPISPEGLVLAYEHGQARAVLLRAVSVVVEVKVAAPAALRVLFRKLKFLRLLHSIERHESGHRIVIDGPFSLFESVTKYGLQLGMILPALEACDVWTLVADVRWGKTRTPLEFRVESHEVGVAREKDASADDLVGPIVTDELAAVIRAFEASDSAWTVSVNTEILELPGLGLIVPDLMFEPRAQAQSKAAATRKQAKRTTRDPSCRVYLEVMGFWSRDAVWKRVELVRAGLAQKILFAVSSRLRVSEAVLDDDLPSALYVYKGTLSPRVIGERLAELRERDGVNS